MDAVSFVIIDAKLEKLRAWLKLENAIYAPDYDKVRAQIDVLNEIKREAKNGKRLV